jgi:hypothetical protein
VFEQAARARPLISAIARNPFFTLISSVLLRAMRPSTLQRSKTLPGLSPVFAGFAGTFGKHLTELR